MSQPIRSYLFLPANRPHFVKKAAQSGADAVVIDLEDSVPAAERLSARQVASRSIEHLFGHVLEIHVRVNPVNEDDFELDCEAVVSSKISGVVLPKVDHSDDILRASSLLSELEMRSGLSLGSISIMPLLETAMGIYNTHSIASSSERVRRVWGGSARDGDVVRSLGLKWTAAGLETLFVRSKIVLESRVAGVDPVTGTWVDVDDMEGLDAFLQQSRSLGYSGVTAIHPSHVPVINSYFEVSELESEYYEKVIREFERAQRDGSSAIIVEGRLIDEAMYRYARVILGLDL